MASTTSTTKTIEKKFHDPQGTKPFLTPYKRGSHMAEKQTSNTYGKDQGEVSTAVDKKYVFWEGVDFSNSLRATSVITKDGGVIKVGQTGVKLEIPPGAIENNEAQEIQITIIPPAILNELAHRFEDHSTTIVEILPNKLRLKKNAILTLPHCLVLKDEKKCKVQVWQNHQIRECDPRWENISESAQPKITGFLCQMTLEQFCDTKMDVSGEDVIAKMLLIYTLVKRIKPEKNKVTAFVGYCPFLPQYKGFVCNKQTGQTFQVGGWQQLEFKKEKKEPLAISITRVIPQNSCKPTTEIGETQHIRYTTILLSKEQNCPFTFYRTNSKDCFPTCHFEVSHAEEKIEEAVDLKRGVIDD